MMNSKNLRKRLEKMGYGLRRGVSGNWVITSNHLTYVWIRETLSEVERFVVDEENLIAYSTRCGG